MNRPTADGLHPCPSTLLSRVSKIVDVDGKSTHHTLAFGWAIYELFSKLPTADTLKVGDWKNDKVVIDHYLTFLAEYKLRKDCQSVEAHDMYPHFIHLAASTYRKAWLPSKPERLYGFLTISEYQLLNQLLVGKQYCIPQFPSKFIGCEVIDPFRKLLYCFVPNQFEQAKKSVKFMLICLGEYRLVEFNYTLVYCYNNSRLATIDSKEVAKILLLFDEYTVHVEGKERLQSLFI